MTHLQKLKDLENYNGLIRGKNSNRTDKRIKAIKESINNKVIDFNIGDYVTLNASKRIGVVKEIIKNQGFTQVLVYWENWKLNLKEDPNKLTILPRDKYLWHWDKQALNLSRFANDQLCDDFSYLNYLMTKMRDKTINSLFPNLSQDDINSFYKWILFRWSFLIKDRLPINCTVYYKGEPMKIVQHVKSKNFSNLNRSILLEGSNNSICPSEVSSKLDIHYSCLSETEKLRKKELELKIEDSCYEIGKALKELSERRLYREDFKTFDEYCRATFNIGEKRAYQLIYYVDTYDEITSSTTGRSFTPTSESQLRPLKALPTKEKQEAWLLAEKLSNGKTPTRAIVTEAVKQIKSKENNLPSFNLNQPVQVDFKTFDGLEDWEKNYNHSYGRIIEVSEDTNICTVRLIEGYLVKFSATDLKAIDSVDIKVTLSGEEYLKALEKHNNPQQLKKILKLKAIDPQPVQKEEEKENYEQLEIQLQKNSIASPKPKNVLANAIEKNSIKKIKSRIAQFLNETRNKVKKKNLFLTDNSIEKIEEWENCLYCKIPGLGARFISKKILSDLTIDRVCAVS